MRLIRTAMFAALGASAMIGAADCGIYGGGGGGPTAEVIGNIDDVRPANTGRDIVVFVYQQKDENPDCTEPELPDSHTAFKYDTVPDGDTAFNIPHSKTGRLVIAFLLDNAGNDADGRIDPGDPVAVLNDPDCVLDDVPNKYEINAKDVRINFTLQAQVGFPDPGRAEAADLTEGPKN